jgi:hypothetical protein
MEMLKQYGALPLIPAHALGVGGNCGEMSGVRISETHTHTFRLHVSEANVGVCLQRIPILQWGN